MINGNVCIIEIFNWLWDLDDMWYEIFLFNVEKKNVSLLDIFLLIFNDVIYFVFKKYIFYFFVFKILLNNFIK